jgi:hypothetical protein
MGRVRDKCLVENSTEFLEDYKKLKVKNNMARANMAATVLETPIPAEKPLRLNLMINMLSQTINSNGEKLLSEWVHH